MVLYYLDAAGNLVQRLVPGLPFSHIYFTLSEVYSPGDEEALEQVTECISRQEKEKKEMYLQCNLSHTEHWCK